MERCCTAITAPFGLHTRPAAQLVALARQFEADIQFHCQGLQGNGKSLFSLQKLPLVSGAEVEICATGTDARAAITALQNWLDSFNDQSN